MENNEEKKVINCFMYHKDHGSKIFTNEADLEKAINDGWVDSPAKIKEDEPSEGKPANLSKLKVDELKQILIEKYEVDEAELRSIKEKKPLLEMIEGYSN